MLTKIKPVNRIPGGDQYITCTHVAMGRPNPKLYIFPMAEGDERFNIIRNRVEDGRQAKWFMVCPSCAASADAVNGVPYSVWRAHGDINLTSGVWIP